MRLLSYLNISNIDDIESDSGYIFNYTLSNELALRGIEYYIILPTKLKAANITRFAPEKCYYVDMGHTKYEVRYRFQWEYVAQIIREVKPDIFFLNQVELCATVKALLNVYSLENIKIATYCHYPALHVSTSGDIIPDYTLNDSNLVESILYNIYSAINLSDAFFVQSNFAKTLLVGYAKKNNIALKKEIGILSPPYDYNLYIAALTSKRSPKILYNHRLYDSYGTKDFIRFVMENPDLSFLVTDPMSNRASDRSRYNSTPYINRKVLSSLKNVQLIDGANRENYLNAIDSCCMAIAPARRACVWSMAIIDCYSRGIPVVGPEYASFPEIIPKSLLFHDESEEREIIDRLLHDASFYTNAIKACQDILPNISPARIADQFISVITDH